MLDRHRGDLGVSVDEKYIGLNQQCIRPLLFKPYIDFVESTLGLRFLPHLFGTASINAASPAARRHVGERGPGCGACKSSPVRRAGAERLSWPAVGRP